jgi:hypothetical protein
VYVDGAGFSLEQNKPMKEIAVCGRETLEPNRAVDDIGNPGESVKLNHDSAFARII